MKKEYGLDFKVSYKLGNMYHTYLIIAQNQKEAEQKALKSIPETSKTILHNFKVERYYRAWNWTNKTIIAWFRREWDWIQNKEIWESTLLLPPGGDAPGERRKLWDTR